MSDAVKNKAREFIANNSGARSAKVLEAALDRGGITTEEILALGYKHAPRARQDAVDFGFPMETTYVKDSDGKRIAKYTLLTEAEIRTILNGRAIIPKAFKDKLVKKYGAADRITGLEVEARALQVDHRIPYQVSGDDGLWAEDLTKFMLLTGSSQRKKSFSCERCPNFSTIKDAKTCGTCYWAYPEAYEHIAMRKVRQIEMVWQDDEADMLDRIRTKLETIGQTVEGAIKDYIKTLDS